MVVVVATLAGGATYLLTNPYVPINLIVNRAVLRSNLGTSTAMYHAGISSAGIVNTILLAAAGASPLLGIVGAIGAIALGWRAMRVRHEMGDEAVRRRAAGLLLAVPALGILAQCALVAAGKPGEFGRFLLVPDIFLAVEAVVAVATFVTRPTGRVVTMFILVLTTAVPGLLYLRGFVRDSGAKTSRIAEADRLRAMRGGGARTLAVYAEPAPYCMPPVDLFRWTIELLPRDAGPDDGLRAAEASVRTVDVAPGRTSGERVRNVLSATPIGWADKPFDVRERGSTGR